MSFNVDAASLLYVIGELSALEKNGYTAPWRTDVQKKLLENRRLYVIFN